MSSHVHVLVRGQIDKYNRNHAVCRRDVIQVDPSSGNFKHERVPGRGAASMSTISQGELELKLSCLSKCKS